MKVVVTGATGNVGTAVLRRLLTDDDTVEVVGLARRVPSGQTDDDARVRWASVDLTHDDSRPTLQWAFEDADAVVHLAWGFQPTHRPERLAELGIGGTSRVLAAAKRAGVPHLVHMSSVGAYSPKVDDCPVDEGYPTDGIATSVYSQHKVAAERMLDQHLLDHPTGDGSLATPQVTRLRPGIVGQRSAGSALLRYALPGLVPSRVVSMLPVLPIDRDLLVPMVHADDLADAVARVVQRRAYGAFNLAAALPLTPQVIAEVLGARHVHVPARTLRAVVDTTWRLHAQPLDAGWLDLGMQVPVMDSRRAHQELDWTPAHSAEDTLRETVAGMSDSASDGTAVLRTRSVLDNLRALVRRGPIDTRQEP